MEIENFILQHFHKTGIWLPTGEKYSDDDETIEEKRRIKSCKTKN